METVISCEKVKEWKNQKGEMVPIYKVGLSDGRGGESFGKPIPVGTPMGELLIEDSGQYGLKIKMKGGAPGFQGGKQRSGNESFALSYAKDLVCAGKVDIAKILSTADKLYGWLEAKKAGGQVAASLPEKPTGVVKQEQGKDQKWQAIDSSNDLPF